MSNLPIVIAILGSAVALGCGCFVLGKVKGRREGYQDGLADAKQAADGTVSPSAAGGPGGVPR